MQRHEGHINYVKDTKIVAGMFAFGETACARPIVSELTWLSLTRGFGGVGNFAYNQPTNKVRAIEERRAAASRYGFSCKRAREAAYFFIPTKLKPI